MSMRAFYSLLRLLLPAFAMSVALAGCDATIHQYPDADAAWQDVTVLLHADRTPPLFYKEIVYDEDGNRTETALEAEASPTYIPHDALAMRFVVEIKDNTQFDAEGNAKVVERRELVVDNDALPPQGELHFKLPIKGEYTAVSWCDYVPEGNPADWHFDTGRLDFVEEDVEHIPYIQHHKSSATGYSNFGNDRRGGLRVVYAQAVTKADGSEVAEELTAGTVPVYMTRPMARIRLYADDLEEFRQSGYDIEDVRVVIVYKQFVSMAYDALEQTTCRWVSTRRLETRPSVVNEEGNVCLAYDYILVDTDRETHVLADFYFLDADGNELTHTTNVDIPLWRNRETVVRSNFLTRDLGTGGISVDENFDGEHVVEIN